jgi:ankyrin repeat protein
MSMSLPAQPNPVEQITEAFQAGEAPRLAQLLERHPEFQARINDPLFAFGATPILCAAQRGHREIIEVLLRFGADINARSQWWAGGFGVLDSADPELSAFLIERGAKVDAHAAARLGMLDKLKELVSADRALVHARGGDGKTPLHCASTIEIADYLLEQGADINARDIDHESTPAQYMVRSRPDVALHLARRGCRTDILMATALGDLELVRWHLDADPECARTRVSDEWFPMVSPKGGGTIYQWELGWYVSAHQITGNLQHDAIFQLLMDRTPVDEQLLVACWLHDGERVVGLLAEHANLVARLSPSGLRQIAHAARNDDTDATRLMLSAGLPVEARSQHNATTLHWAAFHGNVELAEIILRRNPPLECVDADFKGTPLGWAIHGSEHGWHKETGDYHATVEALIRAGAKLPEKLGGTESVKSVLRQHGLKDP